MKLYECVISTQTLCQKLRMFILHLLLIKKLIAITVRMKIPLTRDVWHSKIDKTITLHLD